MRSDAPAQEHGSCGAGPASHAGVASAVDRPDRTEYEIRMKPPHRTSKIGLKSELICCGKIVTNLCRAKLYFRAVNGGGRGARTGGA
eukprot:4641938-Prymnesium_polylepis.1